jgi:hypothetical protein
LFLLKLRNKRLKKRQEESVKRKKLNKELERKKNAD